MSAKWIGKKLKTTANLIKTAMAESDRPCLFYVDFSTACARVAFREAKKTARFLRGFEIRPSLLPSGRSRDTTSRSFSRDPWGYDGQSR